MRPDQLPKLKREQYPDLGVWGLYSLTDSGYLGEGPDPEPTEIVSYSQNDPRWCNLVYAGGTTFGKAGCLVCSIVMIAGLSYADASPPAVAERLRNVGAFVGNLLSKPARIPDAYPKLQWGGVLHYRAKPCDIEGLDKELEQYGATIAEVKWDPQGLMPQEGNQHFVVVTELTPDGDAVIVDPWDGQTKRLSTTHYRLLGWNAARTIYGLRLVRAT